VAEVGENGMEGEVLRVFIGIRSCSLKNARGEGLAVALRGEVLGLFIWGNLE
jgi:hypothetical protein